MKYCIAKQCIEINLLRDFRYVLKDSICCKQLDMSLSRRDLYHIEFEQSENISIYEVKYRANFSLHIDKNGLPLNLMPRNMDMSNTVERKW